MKVATANSSGVIQEDVRIIAEELAPKLAPLAGSSIFIAGGSGFVCSYFLETIAYLNDHAWSSPCRVISADNLRSGVAERVAHLAARREFRFITHDISKPLCLDEPVSWIIHGAGIASPTFYRRYPLETVDVNVSGTRHILELAKIHNAQGVLYLSSSEIYGDPDPQFIPTNEHYRGNVSCTGPRACYDESKRMAETLCEIYRTLYKVPVKIARPFNIYGPGQRLDDCRIIPDLVSAALKRQPLLLYSDGRATRSFCYIRDAIRAMWLILVSDASDEAFNVGNDELEISIAELARELSRVAGPPPLEIIHRVSEDPQYLADNPQRRCPDLAKLRNRFSWSPSVSLAEGLRRTLRSYTEGECASRL
jgi:UDP-glucuronate decarboxylase